MAAERIRSPLVPDRKEDQVFRSGPYRLDECPSRGGLADRCAFIGKGEHPVTADQLDSVLAQRVLGWTAAPERFLTGNRGWLPRWKFQPSQKLADAVRLLEAAAAEEYSVTAVDGGNFAARVRIAGKSTEARAATKPLVICLAVAASFGIEVER